MTETKVRIIRIVAIYYCSMEPGHANLDVLNLMEELRRSNQIHLYSLSKQEDKHNLQYYQIKPLFGHWIFYAYDIFKLIKEIERIEPDIIISDSTFFISIPAFILSKILKIKLVIYCRELVLEITRYMKTPLRSLRRYVIMKSDLVVAIDEGLRDYFEKEIDREVALVPISISFEDFKPKKEKSNLRLPTKHKLILYQGNLSKYRRIDILLESFSKIKPEICDSKIVLAGRATIGDLEYLNNLIEKFSLKGDIIHLPWLSYSEIPSLIYLCDVCVDPYPRIGIEEFQVGLKIIEYMAIGKPVLAINVKGNRFIIKDNHNGLLAEANADDFSKKLKILLDDENLSNKLGQNALKTIQDYHDSKNVGNQFEILINSLMEFSNGDQ
jgi:glycosyltransferase involved in cell wall biosynthesis